MSKTLLKQLPRIAANGRREAKRNCDAPLIFSFFSGAGFLDLGFEKAGYEIGYVNEVHKPFLDAYKHSRRKMVTPQPLHGYFEGDIECCLSGKEAKRLGGLVNAAKKDKRLVGFIGGPPCPDFSVGGKNRGQHGENGKLSQIYIDLICKQKPDFFVFENVKGLYRTARHRQFFDGLIPKQSPLLQAGLKAAHSDASSHERRDRAAPLPPASRRRRRCIGDASGLPRCGSCLCGR
jgi:hypothetical protein